MKFDLDQKFSSLDLVLWIKKRAPRVNYLYS